MSLEEKAQFLGCGLKLKTAHSDKYKIFSLKLPDEFLFYKPVLSAVGNTFNRELARSYGQMCRDLSSKNRLTVDGVINLGVVRDPMAEGAECMLSEEPLVVSELASGFIDGAGAVVGTNILSGETAFSIRTIDERAKRELYFKPTEALSKKLSGVCIPSGTLNGVPVCASKPFSKMLRDLIGDSTPIFSEAGTVINKAETLNLFENFEIAQSPKGRKDIIAEVENGNLDEKRIDRCLERIISLVANRYESLKTIDRTGMLDFDEVASRQSIVLLKNDGILPFRGSGRLAVTGDVEKQEIAILSQVFGNVADIKSAGTVIVFAKNEGSKLSVRAEKALIDASDAGKQTILIILSPRPVETDIIMPANAVLFVPTVYFNTLDALAKIISGEVNPSGKLAVSWAFNKEDYPAQKSLKYNRGNAYCYESTFNGYRYFNSFKKDIQFPFGHGLSYSEFSYSNMQLTHSDNSIGLEFIVKNVGEHNGETVIFVFAEIDNDTVYGLKSRLVGFCRVNLDKSENTRVKIKIPYNNLAVYKADSSEWIIPGGMLKLSVGSDCLHLPLSDSFKLPFSSRIQAGLDKLVAPSYFANSNFNPSKREIEAQLGSSDFSEALKFYTAPPEKGSSLEKKAVKKIKSALKQEIKINLTGFSEFGLLKLMKADN